MNYAMKACGIIRKGPSSGPQIGMWSFHQECCPEHTTGVRTVSGGTESQLLAATRTQPYISNSV
jgi:hypothetical protein